MRTALMFAGTSVVAAIALLAACSSDPAAPEVDEGIDTEEGGTSFGGAAGSSGAAGEAGAAGSAGSIQPAAYPPGPYGHAIDNVVQDFQFMGLWNPAEVAYKADDTTLKPIAMHDFYNPTKDPSKPRVLLVTASARWCTYCKAQATTAQKDRTYWRAQGVEFMETMFEDEDSQPAQAIDLEIWTKTYKFEFPSVLDPTLKLGVFFDKSAAPFNMIIRLSDMKIRFAETGQKDFGESNKNFPAILKE